MRFESETVILERGLQLQLSFYTSIRFSIYWNMIYVRVSVKKSNDYMCIDRFIASIEPTQKRIVRFVDLKNCQIQ